MHFRNLKRGRFIAYFVSFSLKKKFNSLKSWWEKNEERYPTSWVKVKLDSGAELTHLDQYSLGLFCIKQIAWIVTYFYEKLLTGHFLINFVAFWLIQWCSGIVMGRVAKCRVRVGFWNFFRVRVGSGFEIFLRVWVWHDRFGSGFGFL